MTVRQKALLALMSVGLAVTAAAAPAAGASAAPAIGTVAASHAASAPVGGNQYGAIQNDQFWKDTAGNPIHSQGGGVFKFGDTYYWYGVQYKGAAEYENNPTTLAYANDSIFQAITVYSSQDLVHWKFENDVALPSTPLNIPTSKDVVSNDFSRMTSLADASWIGRLGVVYNQNTHKYVIVTQMETSFDSNTKTKHSVLFLQSDTPTGDFQYANLQPQIPNVLYQGTGDQSVFTDDDGASYLVFSNQSGRAHEYVAKIDPADSLSIDPATVVYTNGAGREGNAMFKMDGHYYIASSDLHGWNSSATHIIASVGSDPMGPYNQTEFTLPGTEMDYSHNTQTGFFFTVHGTKQDTVVFAGDRWADFAWNGVGYNQWMPLSEEAGSPTFNSLSNWQLDPVTGEWRSGTNNNYVLNPDIAADRTAVSTITGWTTAADAGYANAFVSNTSPGADGSRWAMTLNSPSGPFSGSVQQQDAVPAGRYSFSAKVKTAGGLDYARAVITSSNGASRTIDLNSSTAGTWSTVTADNLTLSGGQTSIIVEARSKLGNQPLSIDELSLVPDVSAWNPGSTYTTGDLVTYDGSIWEASWWTHNQVPGDPNGPWQERSTAGGDTVLWTATRTFDTGDVVLYGGRMYTAKWWTRDQIPGEPNGPWSING